MPTSTSLAMVHTGPDALELREFPMPTLGRDDGLLRVERCGLCGTDVEQVHGELAFVPLDVIPGHEPVGTIEEIGPEAAARWGVQPGDRVVVEASVSCRQCTYCRAGAASSCPGQRHLGFEPVDHDPPLLGGFAEYLYLPPTAAVHRMSTEVPLDIAPFYNALTCGVDWVTDAGGVTLGSTVVVLGSGARGLACAIVAKAVGAETVIMTGRGVDAAKLEIARGFGVDAIVDVDHEDLRERVGELTGGALADVVIDVVPATASTVADAVDVARPRGTVVLAGIKGERAVPGLHSDRIVRKALTLKGEWQERAELPAGHPVAGGAAVPVRTAPATHLPAAGRAAGRRGPGRGTGRPRRVLRQHRPRPVDRPQRLGWRSRLLGPSAVRTGP